MVSLQSPCSPLKPLYLPTPRYLADAIQKCVQDSLSGLTTIGIIVPDRSQVKDVTDSVKVVFIHEQGTIRCTLFKLIVYSLLDLFGDSGVFQG